MSQPLPTGDFKREYTNYSEGTSSNYDWRNPPENRGCILECDLEYTLNAKFQTFKFPPAPEKLKIKEEELSDYQSRCLKVEGKKRVKLQN